MKKHMGKFNRKPKYKLYRLLAKECIAYLLDGYDDITCANKLTGV